MVFGKKYWYDGYGAPILEQVWLNPALGYGSSLDAKTAYDKEGNILSRTNPDGGTTTLRYDGRGNHTTTIDPLGNMTTTTYNKRDQKTTETHTPNTGTGIYTKTYTYDAQGRLQSETNMYGKTQSFVYDAYDAITRSTDEEGRVTNYTRDYRGLPLTSVESLS